MRFRFPSPKRVLQGFLQDLKEVFQPVLGFVTRVWYFLGPRLTNRAMIAMFLADAALVFHLKTSQTHIDLVSMAIWLAANFVTPLSRPGAPHRIPPPEYGQARGPGVEAGAAAPNYSSAPNPYAVHGLEGYYQAGNGEWRFWKYSPIEEA